MKNTTEGYVANTSGPKLGAMEGQVEGLTDRMVDVDSNLNYMLGQLSLVVQEFNQVRANGSEKANQGSITSLISLDIELILLREVNFRFKGHTPYCTNSIWVFPGL